MATAIALRVSTAHFRAVILSEGEAEVEVLR